jgi:hypothetical protein
MNELTARRSGALGKKGGPGEPPGLPAWFIAELKLNCSSAAEEVEQNGNNGQHQQDVNESAGNVERGEAQQPENQENGSNDR